jgi:hypothetical protein
MIAGRAAVGEDRFLDVHHRELVADPMGTVRRIYEWVGLDLTPESEAAIAAWNDENRSGSHGTHRYTAEEFGLSAGQLRADFDTYVRHFDVELES